MKPVAALLLAVVIAVFVAGAAYQLSQKSPQSVPWSFELKGVCGSQEVALWIPRGATVSASWTALPNSSAGGGTWLNVTDPGQVVTYSSLVSQFGGASPQEFGFLSEGGTYTFSACDPSGPTAVEVSGITNLPP